MEGICNKIIKKIKEAPSVLMVRDAKATCIDSCFLRIVNEAGKRVKQALKANKKVIMIS